MFETYFKIIKNQEGYIKSELPYLLIVIVCCILIRVFYFLVTRHSNNLVLQGKSDAMNKKTTILHELGILVFIIYIITLFFITISLTLQFEKINTKESINIIPVNNLVEFIQNAVKTGNLSIVELKVFGNILLLMPMGFFIPLLWSLKDDLYAVLFGLLVSISIEIGQLYLGLGADVDNLILNSLGALLGYLVYSVCYKAFPKIPKKFKIAKEKVTNQI